MKFSDFFAQRTRSCLELRLKFIKNSHAHFIESHISFDKMKISYKFLSKLINRFGNTFENELNESIKQISFRIIKIVSDNSPGIRILV